MKVDFAFSFVKSEVQVAKCNFEESPAYFFRKSFMKMSISCLLKSIESVKYFESDFLEK